MSGYGKIPRPSGKPKSNPVYPYGQATEAGGLDKTKKGRDANCPNCGVYSQIANKTKKNVSREFNRGPVKIKGGRR